MTTSRDRESDQIEKQQNKKIKTLGLGFVKFATRQRECGTTAFGQRERGGGMRERVQSARESLVVYIYS